MDESLSKLTRCIPQELSWKDYLALGDQTHIHALVREFYYGKCLIKLGHPTSSDVGDIVAEQEELFNSVMSKYIWCKANSSSSLSHRVLQLLSFDQSEFEMFSGENYDHYSFLTEDFTLHWPHFSMVNMLKGFTPLDRQEEQQEMGNSLKNGDQAMPYLDDSDNEMFAHCARFLKFHALEVHSALMKRWSSFVESNEIIDPTVANVQQFLTDNLPYYSQNRLQLMSQPHLLSFFVFEHLTNRSSILCFMSIISFLEHALQDLLYQGMTKQERSNYASHIPKFNDLLLMPQLKQILGEDVIFMFRAFFGPLNSMNLRNVTIHGFISGGTSSYDEAHEFHPSFTSLLIVLVASLNDFIAPYLSTFKERVTQPILSLDTLKKEQEQQELAIINPNNICIDESIINNLRQTDAEIEKLNSFLSRSLFVPPNWKDNWLFAIQEYHLKDGPLCYYNFCTLMYPMLEHAIRRVFVSVNTCADRLLTAERNSYYTTLDILLSTIPSTFLPSGINHIFNDIAEQSHSLCNGLFDLLIWPESLRTRDLIAHGNIDPFSIDKRTADELLALCLALCAQYDPLNKNLAYSATYMEKLPEVVRYSIELYRNEYVPSYHAIHSSQRSITSACSAIEECSNFMSEHLPLKEPNELDLLIQQKVQNLISQLNVQQEERNPESTPTMWPVALLERQVKKSHLLRRTAQYCVVIAQQISRFSEAMQQKVASKTASSRQREQFALLTQHWKTLMSVTEFFYLCTLKQFSQKELPRWEFKSKLCITCERLCSSLCSSIKANKWQRAIETCYAIVQELDGPCPISFSLQSLSPKEAKRLYVDLVPLIQSDIDQSQPEQ